MRFILLASSLFAVLAVPVAAYATPVDFIFTPDGGTAITFSLDPSQISLAESGIGTIYRSIRFSDGSTQEVSVLNVAGSIDALGESLDFQFLNGTTGVKDFDGRQLYRGDESAPIFISGTYRLGPVAILGDTESATLVIVNGVPAVPEPSSLILLSTGVFGGIGALRRRFLKA